jgi:uncharacterized protein YbcI
MPSQEHAPPDLDGPVLAEISRTLVQLHKESYGRGPTKARSFMSDNVLVCMLEGGFLPVEKTLRDHGHADLVTNSSEAMQGVLREQFVQAIEQISGRRVVAFMSGMDEQAELSAELFVFQPDGLDAALG